MIAFSNKGELDMRAVTTFGVSSKDNDQAIGFFGTGLKYAIAILLRHECEVTIWSGEYRYDFLLEMETFRNDEFATVYMTEDGKNKVRLPFTTELGKTWDLWMAYREIYCNCMDEGGSYRSGITEPPSLSGHTLVVVRGEAFEAVHEDRSKYILSLGEEELYNNGSVRILPRVSNNLFYRTIRAYDLPKPANYTYDVHAQMDLSEDRTLKYEYTARRRIAQAIGGCDVTRVIEDALLAPEEMWESHLDFTDCATVSDCFKEVVRRCVKEHPAKVNKTALDKVSIDRNDMLPKESTVQLNDVDTLRLQEALDFCDGIGFPASTCPIIVVERLDDGLVGLAYNGRIYLSRLAFNGGTKYLASTLIEEYIHITYHLKDCTRELQTFLFDTIIGMGEQMNGKPL